jgi:hypothetical protein
MVLFKQGNYAGELGTGKGFSISLYGCVITSVCSALVNCFHKNTDPLKLNQDLINVNGYAPNGVPGVYNLLKWDFISKIYPDVTLAFNKSYPSSPADMALIDGQLQKGCSVIVGVSFEHDPKATQADHYVEIYKKNGNGSYQCRDPWYGDDTSFNARYAVKGMSVAQCILQITSYNGPTQPAQLDYQALYNAARIDRDVNYNCFVKLCSSLNIPVNADDKDGTVQKAIDEIKKLQALPLSNQPMQLSQLQADLVTQINATFAKYGN